MKPYNVKRKYEFLEYQCFPPFDWLLCLGGWWHYLFMNVNLLVCAYIQTIQNAFSPLFSLVPLQSEWFKPMTLVMFVPHCLGRILKVDIIRAPGTPYSNQPVRPSVCPSEIA